MNSNSYTCHICRNGDVLVIDEFSLLCLVTSDCRPWKRGGKLGICQNCSSVQNIIDDDFQNDCKRIYDSYCVYHQSNGAEQRVFEQEGQSQFRSEVLLTKIFENFELPEKGRLLDIGCGNGNLLRSFSNRYPAWRLAGSDLDEKYQQTLMNIKNVDAFYSCDIEKILSDEFDLITMLHCLEHIVDPVIFLKKVRDKLRPGGLLLVEVPDYRQNPFDLIIADHCSHFTIENLAALFRIAGFDIILASDNCIIKELTFLGRKHIGSPLSQERLTWNPLEYENVLKAIKWLKNIVCKAKKIAADNGPFGIFGTSIAATWLCSEIENAVTFFVDEDPNRIGKKLMGRNIYHPKEAPGDSIVFIALPFPLAKKIWERMKDYRANFYLPYKD